MEKKSFFAEMAERFKSDTPTFFKKVQLLGVKIIAVGAALALIPHAPSFFIHIEGFLATSGAVMIAVAKLACSDTPDAQKP